MKKCANCEWLDYYPPMHSYERYKDGHRCGLSGGMKIDITQDKKEEVENENFQHTCHYRRKNIPIQLEIQF